MRVKKLRRNRKKEKKRLLQEEPVEENIIGLLPLRKDKSGEMIRPRWHRWVYGGGRHNEKA